jgi:hypothetical protein
MRRRKRSALSASGTERLTKLARGPLTGKFVDINTPPGRTRTRSSCLIVSKTPRLASPLGRRYGTKVTSM